MTAPIFRGVAPLAAGLLLAAVTNYVQASVVVDVFESGSDVVWSGSGTLNISSLTSQGSGNLLAGSDFGEEFFLGADPGGFPAVNFYGATGQVTAPGALFAGDLFIQPQSGSGPRFGIAIEAFNGQVDPAVTVPSGYVSGAALSATSTYTNKTIASLGLIPGSYVWTWSGDSLTLNIGQVPLPAAPWLFATAFMSLAWRLRRRT
jgi:hypothetical protein